MNRNLFKMCKRTMISSCLLLAISTSVSAQVGIGIKIPKPSAMLDVTATNKGVLIPRIELLNATDVVTVPAPETSLLVFNTSQNIVNFPLGSGYYYWDGAKWVKLTGSGDPVSGWLLKGNTGTNAVD
jgi:hypothetical protein